MGQHWDRTARYGSGHEDLVQPHDTRIDAAKEPIHVPAPAPCPTAESNDREAARLMAHHPEQGWSLLCNGVLLFEDTGELLPDGQIIAPHRPLRSGQVMKAA